MRHLQIRIGRAVMVVVALLLAASATLLAPARAQAVCQQPRVAGPTVSGEGNCPTHPSEGWESRMSWRDVNGQWRRAYTPHESTPPPPTTEAAKKEMETQLNRRVWEGAPPPMVGSTVHISMGGGTFIGVIRLGTPTVTVGEVEKVSE